MRLKGRYIKDESIEIAPYIVDIPRGEGMTQLMVLEAEQPKKELQYFRWDWPEAPKKSKGWVVASVIGASTVGMAAVFALFFVPTVATPVILGCLGWLGVVAFANR